MPVRKTESRIPTGMQPADLGEAIVSVDGKYALVSFLTAPLAAGQENIYVLFVTDELLAGAVKSYNWMVTEDGSTPYMISTEVGELSYQPENMGNLDVTVELRDTADAVVGAISLIQEVGMLNPDLEAAITAATDQPGPGVSNLDAVREITNDYYSYYQSVKLKVPEADDAFKRFICGMLFDGVLKSPSAKRKQVFSETADSLDNNVDAFSTNAGQTFGVCALRLALLAMHYPVAAPLLEWTELPEDASGNALADELLRQKLNTISETDKIDLVTITRFPKTNIEFCANIIENLRNKYFPGAAFKDVMTGMNGTRQHWIIKHYTTGPIAK